MTTIPMKQSSVPPLYSLSKAKHTDTIKETKFSSVTCAAFEELDSDIRTLLLSNRPNTGQVWDINCCNDGDFSSIVDDDPIEAEIVSQFVQHVMSHPSSNTRQQEVALKAAQQLEAIEQKLETQLCSEIVLCNDQLLNTIAASDILRNDLLSLATLTKSLQTAVGRMTLRCTTPLEQLRHRVEALHRCDNASHLIILMKQLAHLIRLYEAQFVHHFKSLMDETDSLSKCSSVDLLHACQIQLDMELLVEELYQSLSVPDRQQQDEWVASPGGEERSSLSNLPILQNDIQWIRENGTHIMNIGNFAFIKGLENGNQNHLSTGCHLLLRYGGFNLFVSSLKLEMSKMLKKTLDAFHTHDVFKTFNSDYSSKQIITQTLMKSTRSYNGQMKEGGEHSIEQVVWKTFHTFIKLLETYLKQLTALDLVLLNLQHNDELLYHLQQTHVSHSTSEGASILSTVCSRLVNSGLFGTKNECSNRIHRLFWMKCIEDFQLQFRRLIGTSSRFKELLIKECPKLMVFFSNVSNDINDVFHLSERPLLTTNFSTLLMHQEFKQHPSQLSSNLLSDVALLMNVLQPIITEYIDQARLTITKPVHLMFPMSNHSQYQSTTEHLGIPLPTNADIKTFVNVLVTEIHTALPAKDLHNKVLHLVEESLILCISKLREFKDILGVSLMLPTIHDNGEMTGTLPIATLAHKRNAQYYNVSYTLCDALCHAFGIQLKETTLSSNGFMSIHTPYSTDSNYDSLNQIIQLIILTKESFTSNWFQTFQNCICDEYLFNLIHCIANDNQDSIVSQTSLLGLDSMKRVHGLSGYIQREFFSLLLPASIAYHQLLLCRYIIQYFLAVTCLIKPLSTESQRVALAAHSTSLEVTLSSFFCSTLHESLLPECTLLKNYRHLLFIEFNQKQLFVQNQTNQQLPSSEKVSYFKIVQTIPSLFFILHLLSRLPNDIPSLSDYLKRDPRKIVAEIANSLSFHPNWKQENFINNDQQDNTVVDKIPQRISPACLRETVKKIIQTYTISSGQLVSGASISKEDCQIILLLRQELSLDH